MTLGVSLSQKIFVGFFYRPSGATPYLYVSVGEQQVHDDVLREDLGVVDPEFDAGQLLGQLLALVLLPGLADVVQQGVLVGGAARNDGTATGETDQVRREKTKQALHIGSRDGCSHTV